MRPVILLLVLSVCSPAISSTDKHPPEITKLTVVGEAPASVPNARDLAIADALRNALMQAIGVHVSATTIGDNYKLVRSEVVSKSSGFAVLEGVESSSVENGILKVRVRASISNRPLAEKLKELGLTHEWKIGIVVYGKGKLGPNASAIDSGITKPMVDAGFRVMDSSRTREMTSSEAALRAAEGDRESLAAIAREFDVDILIALDALVEAVDSTKEGGVTFYRTRCSVGARAYYADTGEVLAVSEAGTEALDQTESLSARQCLRKAVAKLGKILADDLLIAPAAPTPFVVVKVTDLKDMTAAAEIEEALRAVPGVTQVVRQRYTEGTLELSICVNSELKGDLPNHLAGSKPGRKLRLRTEAWTKTYLQLQATL